MIQLILWKNCRIILWTHSQLLFILEVLPGPGRRVEIFLGSAVVIVGIFLGIVLPLEYYPESENIPV